MLGFFLNTKDKLKRFLIYFSNIFITIWIQFLNNFYIDREQFT